MRYTVEFTFPESIEEPWDNGLSDTVFDLMRRYDDGGLLTTHVLVNGTRLRLVLSAPDNYTARTYGLALHAALEALKPLSATIAEGRTPFIGTRYDLLED